LGAYEDQNYIYTDPSLVAGEENISGHFSPISVISPGHIAHLSGIEPFDVMLLNAGIIFALIALTAYFAIRKLSRSVALLAIPLTLLMVSGKHFAPVTFGIMGLVYGYFFLILFCWSLSYLFKEGYGFILIGLTAVPIIMAHGNQIAYAIFISIIYITFYVIRAKKITERLMFLFLRRIVIIAAIVIILAGYSFLLQFLSCRGGGMSLYTPGKPILTIWNIPNVFLPEFGWWILGLSALGAVILLIAKKSAYAVIIAGLFLLGLLNYIGIAYPAFQQRFFWPVALSLFFGAGVYAVLKFFKIKRFAVFVSLGLIILISLAYAGQKPNVGIMDDYHWDAFQKIKEGTPEGSEILIPALGPYTQASIKYLLEREPYENRDFELMYGWAVKIMNNETISNQTIYTHIGTENTCRFPTRNGFLNIGWKDVPKAYLHPREYCGFDYYIFDKVTYRREDMDITSALYVIRNRMLSKDWIDVFYENALVIVVRNKDKTKDCINNG